MAKEFLGRGWKFPVGVDSKGAIAMSEYEEDIRQSIYIILSTSKGERVMRPDFGCGIHDYVFESVNRSTLTLIETCARDALTIWEPRIELRDVRISSKEIDQGRLTIEIDYEVRTTNNQFSLVYPFYLLEGE
jgi:phage baseplate assembly protein W